MQEANRQRKWLKSWKNDIMHLCFYCISYWSFGSEIAGETKPQPCYILNNSNTLDRFIGFIVFAERRHQKIIEVMMLIKIIGESIKFIGIKYIHESLIKMSLQLYISYLNKHIVTLYHVSLLNLMYWAFGSAWAGCNAGYALLACRRNLTKVWFLRSLLFAYCF